MSVLNLLIKSLDEYNSLVNKTTAETIELIKELQSDNARLAAENKRLRTKRKIIINACVNTGDLDLIAELARTALQGEN